MSKKRSDKFTTPTDDRATESTPAESFISVDEGAALLAVPPNTLYKMALARRVPSYKIGKLRRFRRSELLAFAESFRVNADQ